jgi:TRAP-type C4-dicarboxylate transport system substrate-binding protein
MSQRSPVGENRPMRAHVAVLLAACLFAGCLGADEGTKAGAARGPVTLQLAADDPPDRPGSDQIYEFARRVQRLSGGDIRIQPVLNAGGDDPNWDQRVLDNVRGGKWEMGLIPARAWDTEGVTSLRALNAPFLITSEALRDDVIASELADDLLSGLKEAGVHGLALFPEGLRHPFGFERPLLGPGDYAGAAIRSPTSATAAAVFEALGATTNDADMDAVDQAGMESSYDLTPAGTATGNVTFFPKANALVINDEALERLDERRRAVLEKAAVETREWAIQTLPSDADAAAEYCRSGGAVVLASDADLAALERATAPVYAELERDEQTRQLIEAIRQRKNEVAPPAPPAACGRPEGRDEARAGGGADPRFDGVYRIELTDADLRAAGITARADLDENHGIYTITIEHGSYCWEQRAPNPVNNPDECSTYEVDGSRVVWHYPIGPPEVYRFERAGDGDLQVTLLRAGTAEARPYAEAWAAQDWQRLGGD